MIEIPQSPSRETNKKHKHNPDAPCVVCGKAVKNPRYFLHVWNGFYAVTETEADAINSGTSDTGLTPAGDTGLYPLGSNCLKKHAELKSYLIID